MKPEGNRAGSCMGLNEKPQRLIDYKDEAQAKSIGCLLVKATPNWVQSFNYRYLEFFRHESGKR